LTFLSKKISLSKKKTILIPQTQTWARQI